MKKLVLLVLFAMTVFFCFSQATKENTRNKQQQHNVPKAAPDYADLFYWAAHPFKHDYSDSIPGFLKGEKRDTSVDVFFLYPTTFTGNFLSAPLNGDVNDTTLNLHTDMTTILMQASIFNGSARVFSPRYRQAHLKAFYQFESKESQQAFDLAYNDLKTAFQYYLDHWNHGRPIIIAGHSQGSMHAIRLLKEFFDGKPLQKQLVCAYIPGWKVSPADFQNIPLGIMPTQSDCVLTWRTYKKGTTSGLAGLGGGNSWCVNPISWRTDTNTTIADMQKGAVIGNFNRSIAHKITAGISNENHVLFVDGFGFPAAAGNDTLSKLAQTGNFHILDFNLFYMDIRENVKLRINDYSKNHSGSGK